MIYLRIEVQAPKMKDRAVNVPRAKSQPVPQLTNSCCCVEIMLIIRLDEYKLTQTTNKDHNTSIQTYENNYTKTSNEVCTNCIFRS